MRRWPNIWLVAVAAASVVVVVTLVAHAQSLGELARKEEARRKSVKAPAKVYTNENIQPAPSVTPPLDQPAAPGSTPAASGSRAPGDRPPSTPAERPPDDPRKTESYWRERMASARQQRDRNSVYMDALQSRINALWADFTARDDPAQRAVIAAERQRALAELERLKQEQANLDKQILDIEEDARREGIPPGWIR
jgi:hypothetical protein